VKAQMLTADTHHRRRTKSTEVEHGMSGRIGILVNSAALLVGAVLLVYGVEHFFEPPTFSYYHGYPMPGHRPIVALAFAVLVIVRSTQSLSTLDRASRVKPTPRRWPEWCRRVASDSLIGCGFLAGMYVLKQSGRLGPPESPDKSLRTLLSECAVMVMLAIVIDTMRVFGSGTSEGDD
jgi:hypothetical protein